MKNQLKDKRLQKGFLKIQFANKAQIPLRTYQRYETGERKPDVVTAIRIAKVLNSSVEELWGESRSD